MSSTVWQNLTDAIGKGMSIDEMGKKYLNTYLVLITPKQEHLMVQYKGYQDGYHILKDENDMTIRLSDNTEANIVCMFPERQLFNYNKVALEFVRLPLRQYKRGICKENITIYSPVRQLLDGRVYNWSIKTLKAALFPEYPENCEQAIQKLLNKEVLSIALNDSFMLSQNFTSLNKTKTLFYLWFKNKVIGFFTKDTFHIKHSLFHQEVLDNIHLLKPYKIEF